MRLSRCRRALRAHYPRRRSHRFLFSTCRTVASLSWGGFFLGSRPAAHAAETLLVASVAVLPSRSLAQASPAPRRFQSWVCRRAHVSRSEGHGPRLALSTPPDNQPQWGSPTATREQRWLHAS